MPSVTWDTQADWGTRYVATRREAELVAGIVERFDPQSIVVVGSGLGAGVAAFRRLGVDAVGLDSAAYLATLDEIVVPWVLGDIKSPPDLDVDLGVSENLLECFPDDKLPDVWAGMNQLTDRWVHIITAVKADPYWKVSDSGWNVKSLAEWKALQPDHWFADAETHEWL